ncbi:MAG: HPr kinase/phosphatase C-terminal domain-containing protein [Pseudomonadota bacterium]
MSADDSPDLPPVTLHASCVAIAGRGLLILGPSGSGKSALTIELLALGAGLVSDDRTIVQLTRGALTASAPDAIRGLIEMRGLGLMQVPPASPTPLCQAIDLDQSETDRLPQSYTIEILRQKLPLLRRPSGSHLASALMLHMTHGLFNVAATPTDQYSE